ncbi:potassium transporter peripheral membrane protein [Thiomicrospira aerophila AL3]|uniref:Trk system potassium uptake protein TrkA n=1 Tax=Thiomicrospira aerophila AL3 TaxID=717772 RepID=W0DXJ1_9GAMM|nr:Trk system potassium transporter TrkA [Thiomicrospira aerophila]AHF01998.1 potassium transporter peripheral membrane protein [Thiomicrospira aerophila AL3]
MNIIILGAGQVGSSLAELLVTDDNDITLVDLDNSHLQRLQDRLDIRTVHGHASHPDILIQAGLETADLLIAATQNDETNICACQIAHILQKSVTKIARVRGTSYLDHPELFDKSLNDNAIPIDVLISPEGLVTNYIMQLINYPGSLQVIDFADGRVRLVAMRAHNGGPLVGKKIAELKHHLPSRLRFRIVAIYRQDEVVMPTGDVTIRVGDEVFFMAEPHDISQIVEEFRREKQKRARNIMIAGGGHIGFNLAKQLENSHQVKIIEHNITRAREIAEVLDRAIIINGDVADKDLLIEENIDEIDLFIAVTNQDEANIISSMLAKKLGVKRVIALVNNQSYLDLIHLNSIDIAISADRITTNNLLHYMRKGDTVKAFTLRRGTAEAMEVIVHGSENSSKIIGKRLIDVDWPQDITIGCIIRDNKVMLAHRDLVIEAEDHVILFLTDRSRTQQISELFSPEQKRGWLR